MILWIMTFLLIILFFLIGTLVLIKNLKAEPFCIELNANDYIWETKESMPYNNCYSYAFTDIDTNRLDKPQPGFKVNLKPLESDNYTCEALRNRVLLDHPGTTYIGNNSDTAYSQCECDQHMAYLALDKEGVNKDYHFYRKNTDGFWTHKPGGTEVFHTDASGNIIKNPVLADRNYPTYNYSTSCGFFCTPTVDLSNSSKKSNS